MQGTIKILILLIRECAKLHFVVRNMYIANFFANIIVENELIEQIFQQDEKIKINV